MSKKSSIEWTDHTGGPWLVCDPVSAGCKNCYAWAQMERRFFPLVRAAYRKAGLADWETRSVWGAHAPRVLTKTFWTEARRINRQHAQAGTTGRWFPSMLDFLDSFPAGILDQDGNWLSGAEVLADFLSLVRETPNLTWLLLTKRPENWLRQVDAGALARLEMRKRPEEAELREWLRDWIGGKPPANVWIGTSVEDQTNADRRIPELLKIPAAGRFLSLEPLLGPVRILHGMATSAPEFKLDWLIIGGESGPGSRPCNVEWIRGLVAQGKAAGVPTFVKQLGAKPQITPQGYCPEFGTPQSPMPLWNVAHPKGGDPAEWPEDLRVREFPEFRRNG